MHNSDKDNPIKLSEPAIYKMLVEDLEDHAIFIMDKEGIIQTWNLGAEKQLGYTAKDVLGKHFGLIFTKEDVALSIPEGELAIAQMEGRCRDDRKHIRKDGVELWVNGVVTVIRDESGELLGYSKVLNDISARIAAEETIRHQAMHDMLTGLPNRKLMNDFLVTTLADAEEKHNKFAVLMIDLDKFKEINNTYGHEVGDILLENVALRLAGIVRREDMVARFGGDKFVVILREAKSAEGLAEKIAMSLVAPVSLNGLNLRITASIGIALYPRDGESATSLLKAADKALGMVKEKGGNDHVFAC